jgi:hypothetical protein
LLPLGQTVQVGTWEVAVTELHWEKAVYFYDDSVIAMGKYLIVVFDAKNLSPGTDYFRQAMNLGVFDSVSGNWKKYTDRTPVEIEAEWNAQWEFGGRSSVYEDVAPGATVSILVLFDMPETLASAQFDVGLASDITSLVSFTLGDVSQIPPYKPQ